MAIRMNRREVLKSMAAGTSTLALGASLPAAEKPKRPTNVLVIHTDQHRLDCLGAYGHPDIETPHIDRLAADGVRYENSFCPFPVCTPSRYSLLSGLYVHEHRGWNNRSTLAPEIDTFPRVLRAAGYKTKAVGKMHFLPTYLDVGFDELQLAEQDGPGRWDDDYHRYLMERGLVDRNDLEDQRSEYRKRASKQYWDTCGAMVSNLPEEHHATTWIGNRAVETLDGWQADRGQLLMVGFIKPHHPFDPPAPWHEMYDPAKLTVLPGWTEECLKRDINLQRGYFPNDQLTEKKLRLAMAYYYATISQIDFHVGRMIASLQKKGLYDNTLIVFTSDHGEFLGFHHLLLKGNYMYDPLVKVPLIVKHPGNSRAGEASRDLVTNVDVAPTICRAAGCQLGARMHGRDLAANKPAPKLAFSETGRAQAMVRSHTRKLIATDGRHPDLFFDLEKDPLEMKNVHDEPAYQSEVKEFRQALAEWRPADTNFTRYADQNAPQIKQPNVPPQDLSHRDAIIEYYKKKMDAEQAT